MVLAAACAVSDRAAFLPVAIALSRAASIAWLAAFTWVVRIVLALARFCSASSTFLGANCLASNFLKGMALHAFSAAVNAAPSPVFVAALVLSLKLFLVCQK